MKERGKQRGWKARESKERKYYKLNIPHFPSKKKLPLSLSKEKN